MHRWLFPIENESCDDFLKKKEEKTMAYLLDKCKLVACFKILIFLDSGEEEYR